MKLFIAGGVGEHGRNCFFAEGDSVRFLVDCGKMADTPSDPYPRLTPEKIRSLDAVFLTHSHADHTGALPWLYENGFRGTVAASAETLRQLPFDVPRRLTLEKLCPCGEGKLDDLAISWGRSGHCAGSVWYQFTENGSSVFFSGDYTEDTRVYACDRVRSRRADLAVLDCAYGLDDTPYEVLCDRLVHETKKLLSERRIVLFPVPKYGRGLEILALFSERLSGVSYYADKLFLENLKKQHTESFWYKPDKIGAHAKMYRGQTSGIVFVSDPQLRSGTARNTADQVLSFGGAAVMTGTLEKGSYSESLFTEGKMKLLRYPVHLNRAQFDELLAKNDFAAAIPYHSRELTAASEISF